MNICFSSQGNRKGPIGRWDFETTEEYSNYMNQKEALPKAAFQYGVKMADGRKTRRIPGEWTCLLYPAVAAKKKL